MMQNARTGKVVLLLSILVAGFWLLANLVDVYQWDAGGAIFELLWLPAVAMLIVLPIIALVNLVKEKFKPGSFYYLFSILIIGGTILFMNFGM